MKRLSAIDIAEGALLADVAVIFQLIWIYLPLPGLFFRLLIPIVFTVIVLRRNLSTGLLALAVALFVAAVVSGPWILDLAYFALEGAGGLAWGLALKRRWGHLLTLSVGAGSLTVSLSALNFLTLVVVLPVSEIIRSYQRAYALGLTAADFLASQVGLGDTWHATFYPIVVRLGDVLLANWLLLLFAVNAGFAVPAVLVTYTVTNVLVRMMGYDVAPFPGGFVDRFGKRLGWRLLRLSLRLGILGRRRARA